MENTGFGIVNGPSKVHVGTIHKASGFQAGIPLNYGMICKFTSRGKVLEQSGQDVQGDADLKTGLVALLSNSCFTTRLSLFLGVFFFSDFWGLDLLFMKDRLF